MGIAFITGMQGDDAKYFRVIATAKHFAVHSGPETTRHMVDVTVSKHDMEDTYLPAFRAAVTEGKVDSVMCAYNRINGQPACANDFLMKNQLRGAWGFNGYVVSDCDAIVDIFSGHHFTKSMPEAAAVALKTGMDSECADFFTKATTNSDYVPYVDAVKQGLLTEKDIDVAVKRLFTGSLPPQVFDPPEMVPYALTPDSEIDSEAHRALALKAARESIVLLKNDGVLLLSSDVRKIAVFGPLAESVEVLYGNYNGTASHATTALDGITKQFASTHVTFTPGMNFLRPQTVVPSAALSTEDGQPGLKAESILRATKFEGTPQVVRVDNTIDLQLFHPDQSALELPSGMKEFSARWTGFLTPAESGTYEIGLIGSMNQLWLDGRLLIDDLGPHDPNPSNENGATR